MKSYTEFHDGSFDGLLLDTDTAYIFVSTAKKERHVFVARNSVFLLANEIREGNILLDVSTRLASEVTLVEVAERAVNHPSYSAGPLDAKILEAAKARNLAALSIDPSYGATCFAFAEAFELLRYEEWCRNVLRAEMSREV